MNYGVFKLKTGPEVFGSYEEVLMEGEDLEEGQEPTVLGWRITQPMVLEMAMGEKGPQLMLAPWAKMFKPPVVFELDRDDVFLAGPLPADIKAAYQQVTSPIALPQQPSIITGVR